ncbi:MAG: efflux transporter outer membrane subunit [Planctomycetota bacterium]
MNRPTKIAALLAAAALAACYADPPPRTDDRELGIEIPAQWSTPDAPLEQTLREDWWREFGEPRLDALIEAALQHNRNLQAAAARLEAAAATHTIAGGPILPELDGSLDAGRSRRLFIGFPFGGGGVPSSTFTTYGLSLTVRWELDVWGRVRQGDAAALADQEAAVEDLLAARLSLVGQLCRAWFQAVEAQQQLQLAADTARTFAATLEDVRDRFQRGVRPALEVHQAATNLANAEASVAQRREQLQRALRQLDVLVGRYPDGATSTGADLPQQLPEIPAGLPSTLLLRRPDLRAAERRVAAAGCRVEQARAALYPKLALTASGGTTSTDIEDLIDTDYRIWSVGANLLEPLFRGGALRAEVRRQAARRVEAFATYGNAVLSAFAEVEDLLATEQLLATRTAHIADAAEHAVAARDLARERWQLGLTDFLSVADGQRAAFAAEAARITARRLCIENRIDLLLALGGGYAQDNRENRDEQ